MKDLGNRIRSARKAKKLTQGKLAQLCSTETDKVTTSAVSNWENGINSPSSAKFNSLARALDVSVEWIITGNSTSENSLSPVHSTTIPIIGEVQAGAFEAVLERQQEEWSYTTYGNDKGFPLKAIFALRVKGDSMDRDFPEGTTIICLDLFEHPIQLKPGHRVIVHSRHPHMDAWEATCKELFYDGENWILKPNSSNPVHLPIVIPNGDGHEFHHEELGDIRITAVVIDSQKSWL